MGLEKGVTREEFHEDAPNTPDITRETPAQIQDDLGCPVMPRGNNGRMVFVVERGRAKINESDLAVEENAPLAGVAGIRVRGGWDGAVVGECLVCVADKENVFGLEVGMDEVEVMED